ncbi:MAG: Guanylate kinaselike protein [Patescibacteria group bacterium]|nr:Guanylate kinaselike protein [Patescibacteria group bacterium]
MPTTTVKEIIQVEEVVQPARFRWRTEKQWSRKGHILIPSGTMGSGKSTVVRVLLRKYDGAVMDEDTLRAASRYLEDDLLSGNYGLAPEFRLIPSHTTRPKRDGDFSGEYIYHSNESFDALEKAGKFAWMVPVGGHRYGTLTRDIKAALTKPVVGVMTATPDTILEKIEVTWIDQGDILPLYIDSPHRKDWMALRGGLAEEKIQFREEENLRWDKMVDRATVRFWRIENRDEGNLWPVLQELAHVISKMKRHQD